MNILRRIRGTLGTALTWGATFALVGIAGGLFIGIQLAATLRAARLDLPPLDPSSHAAQLMDATNRRP